MPSDHLKVGTQHKMAADKATNLYTMLNRNLRSQLYNLMMADDACPFRDGPDDSPEGRWFVIATGDYAAPAAQMQLNEIVAQLPLSDVQKEQMYNTYVKHLQTIIVAH